MAAQSIGDAEKYDAGGRTIYSLCAAAWRGGTHGDARALPCTESGRRPAGGREVMGMEMARTLERAPGEAAHT
jgi:hypothetical protein